MRLSEQIANTCCGALADKKDLIDRAERYERLLDLCVMHMENMDGMSAALFREDIRGLFNIDEEQRLDY